jgi:hypothetical protein
VLPVTVWAAVSTVDGTLCHALPLQKKTPSGGVPVYANVTLTGGLNAGGTLPSLTVLTVRSNAPPAKPSAPLGGGLPARATRILVS